MGIVNLKPQETQDDWGEGIVKKMKCLLYHCRKEGKYDEWFEQVIYLQAKTSRGKQESQLEC